MKAKKKKSVLPNRPVLWEMLKKNLSGRRKIVSDKNRNLHERNKRIRDGKHGGKI